MAQLAGFGSENLKGHGHGRCTVPHRSLITQARLQGARQKRLSSGSNSSTNLPINGFDSAQ